MTSVRQHPEDDLWLSIKGGRTPSSDSTTQVTSETLSFYPSLFIPSSWWLPYLWTSIPAFVSNEFLLSDYFAVLNFHIFFAYCPSHLPYSLLYMLTNQKPWQQNTELNAIQSSECRVSSFYEPPPCILPFEPNSTTIELQSQFSSQICRLSI